MQIVWFKRDLRVSDHAPLACAASRGASVFLYVYEPELLRSEEFDPAHLVFINESLRELDTALRSRGAHLTVRVGSMPEVLERLHEQRPVEAVWSHQETGSALTYARDRRVGAWLRRRGIPWHELPQHGVVRPLASRDGWAAAWLERMREPLAATPERLTAVAGVVPGHLQACGDLGLPAAGREQAQRGGEGHAQVVLQTFLDSRGVNYREDMSSPLQGETGCSRISPYLAWGNISIRQVYQRTRERVRELKATPAGQRDPRWLKSLASFEKRLRWHCHFIQKLEDEPELEYRNMSRAYDGLREACFDQALFQAWQAGQTGYPMVDACMRALHASGWINFRMRAMLVSFASYQLWLHWRPTAVYLSRQFLDFEPGIHFSQVQMQSGVTGINAIRIYSPIKQVRDQDPRGRFIRRYCPELSAIPDEYLPQPERMPSAVQNRSGCIIGRDYPLPIVDHTTAYREARQRIFAARAGPEARSEARRVYLRHGSRRRPRKS